MKTIENNSLSRLIPYPQKDANKYTRGKLTIIGGSKSYPGAVCLAADAALRCGAGYVEVICDKASLPIVSIHNPNIVSRSWDGFSCNTAGLDHTSQGHPKACLIGSGFDLEDEEQMAILENVMEQCDCPLVIDGGALGMLARDAGSHSCHKRSKSAGELVLTPHYGEAARLAMPFGIDVPVEQFKVLEDDAAFAQSLARAYSATIVLKGPKTIIATCESDECYLMDEGCVCLAKAGTGDVLAGMTSSFLAQGMTAMDAAKLATSLHALSAHHAGAQLSEICVCASDVIDHLPDAIKELSS